MNNFLIINKSCNDGVARVNGQLHPDFIIIPTFTITGLTFEYYDPTAGLYVNNAANWTSTITNNFFTAYGNNLDDLLSRIRVEITATNLTDIPCGYDIDSQNPNIFYLYISIADLNSLYEYGINLLKGINLSCCDVPSSFIKFSVDVSAIEAAIKLNDYIKLESLWKKYYNSTGFMISIFNNNIQLRCGCV